MSMPMSLWCWYRVVSLLVNALVLMLLVFCSIGVLCFPVSETEYHVPMVGSGAAV
jgi:hypothetical protein